MSAPEELNGRIAGDPFLIAANNVLRTLVVEGSVVAEAQNMQEQLVGPAEALVPCFTRLRAIRAHYGQLELEKYKQEWRTLELLDGTHGDLGKLSKLETGRRGLRDGYTPEALSHEVVDCLWSLVVVADSIGVDPARACMEADRKGPVAGTPRQLINRLNATVSVIDEVFDPPPEPYLIPEGTDRDALLGGCFAEGFRTVAALAQAYGVNLPRAIEQNMDLLERRIQTERLAA